MHYLDANVFIYPALYEGEKARGAKNLLEAVVAGDEQAATASLTLDEVVWILSQNTSRETAIEQGRRILEFPNLRVLGVDAQHALRALQHMEDSEWLKPRDAIHLAAMDEHDLTSIVSDDDDFERIDSVQRLGLTAFGDD